MIGLGGYVYLSGRQQLTEERAKMLKTEKLKGSKKQLLKSAERSLRLRSMGITGLSLSLVGLGIYRWAN